MKESRAKVEVINDKDGSIYAWTPDGPYFLLTTLTESNNLKNDQTIRVRYEKYGQYAQLVG